MNTVKQKVEEFIYKTPYYKNNPKYSQASELTELPLLYKDDVINNYSFIVNKSSKHLSLVTSGSTGTILDVVWDYNNYINSIYYIWKIRNQFGIEPLDKYCSCYLNGGITSNIINSKLVYSKNLLLLSKFYTDPVSLEFYFREINKFKPKWMMIQPSFLYILTQYMLENNVKFPDSIKYIELNGEMLTDEMLIFFNKNLRGLTLRNMYGLQEFNAVAFGETASKMTVITDNVYLEVVDDEGNPCVNGIEGNIVITGLHNRAMPLIRYVTNDRGSIIIRDGQQVLNLKRSRANDIVKLNGIVYDGSIFWGITEKINSKLSNKIITFKYVYSNNDLNCYYNFHTPIKKDSGLESYIRETITSELKYNFDSINIETEYANAMENCGLGRRKLKYFENQNLKNANQRKDII